MTAARQTKRGARIIGTYKIADARRKRIFKVPVSRPGRLSQGKLAGDSHMTVGYEMIGPYSGFCCEKKAKSHARDTHMTMYMTAHFTAFTRNLSSRFAFFLEKEWLFSFS